MAKRLLISEVFGIPRGFILALAAAFISTLFAFDIAIQLDGIRSFGEIAVPFVIGIVTGLAAASFAVATSRALRTLRERGEDSRIKHATS